MEITDPKRAALASAANTLLSSEAFRDAMAIVEADLSERWKTAGDTESREAVYHKYDGLRGVTAHLLALSGEWEMHVEATKEN